MLSRRIYMLSFFVLLLLALFNYCFSEKIVLRLETTKEYEVIAEDCIGEDCPLTSTEVQRMHVRDLLNEKEFELMNKPGDVYAFEKFRNACNTDQIYQYADRQGPCKIALSKDLLGQYFFLNFDNGDNTPSPVH